MKQLSLSAETDKRLCCDKVIAQRHDSRSRHRTENLLGPDTVLRCVTDTRQMASVMDIPYLDACLKPFGAGILHLNFNTPCM